MKTIHEAEEDEMDLNYPIQEYEPNDPKNTAFNSFMVATLKAELPDKKNIVG
jgi:hypothetical protein